MSAIVNKRDVLLHTTTPRLIDTGEGGNLISLIATSTVFKVSGGSGSPTSIVLTAFPTNPEWTVNWAIVTGAATLAGTGNTRTLTYANMTTDNVAIQVSVSDAYVVSGITLNTPTTYTDIVNITKVLDGTNGFNGQRGSLNLYASGSTWSDAAANAAVLSASGAAAKVIGDVVTISNGGTFVSVKGWSGTAWIPVGQVIDGNLIVTNSVKAASIDTNGLTLRDTAGNVFLSSGAGLSFNNRFYNTTGVPENGATVGARAGANLRDAAGAIINDSDVKNAVLVPSINKAAGDNLWMGDLGSIVAVDGGGGLASVNYLDAKGTNTGVVLSLPNTPALVVWHIFNQNGAPNSTYKVTLKLQVVAGMSIVVSTTNASLWSTSNYAVASTLSTEPVWVTVVLQQLVESWAQGLDVVVGVNYGSYPIASTIGNVAVCDLVVTRDESLSAQNPITGDNVNKVIGAGAGLKNVELVPSINAAATTSTWEGVSGPNKPIHYRVVGYGLSVDAISALSGCYKNGAQITGVGRSYSLTVIHRVLNIVVFNSIYDVYTNTSEATRLANDLNALDSNVIIVVISYDEPQRNRLSSALTAAMYRCGASRAVFGSSEFKRRSAYALVGIPGGGEGNGAEAYQGKIDDDPNARIDLSFAVAGGNIIGVSGSYTPTSLADFGYTGDIDATRGAPAGTLVGNTPAVTVENNAVTALSNANSAVGIANSAASNAVTAQTSADVANSALANIASDSILSPSEKPSIAQDYGVITGEQSGIDAQASSYGITAEKTAYDDAIAALGTYLSALSGWNTIPGSDVAINGYTFRSKFADVYTAKQALLNKIAARAKEIADAAQSTANSALGAANSANSSLTDKLNKSAGDVLSGQISLMASGAIVVGSAGFNNGDLSGTGVVISRDGLAAINNGVAKFTLYSDGNAYFGGTMYAGNININNRFIVGADGTVTIKSANSGQRMELTSSLLQVFDGNGTLRVRMGVW